MILPFSTQLNGKPTYFVEKIIIGIVKSKLISIDLASELLQMPMSEIKNSELKPKLHTIREDKKERWKPGTKIDFFINCRQKDMFRFAPVLPVVSVQMIEIFHFGKESQSVWINNRRLSVPRMKELAQNDGFDTIENFFAYFNEDFKGKLIHWTDLKY